MDTQTRKFFDIISMMLDEQRACLPEETTDWAFLSQTARKQNLLPLFFEAADTYEAYKKSEVYEKDRLDTWGMVTSQIQRSAAFTDIYEKITAEGIYPIVLKGIVCRQLYGAWGEHRPSGDEDILVEIKDFPRVRAILEREHYRCSVSEISGRTLEELQEISFYNPQMNLNLEVHTNIIGKETESRVQMNHFFDKVHEHAVKMQIYGIEMKVLEPTESLLFLILHAYKHFLNRGVGLRPVIDILLYYREYKQQIAKEYLQEALRACRAENFWLDVQYIGTQYFRLTDEKPARVCTPEALLQDMLQAGTFGGREKADHIAANINLAAENSLQRTGKLYTLFRAAFSTKQVLMAGYPYLAEKPWLLPAVWVKRWLKFLRYAKKDVWKLSKTILQKSSARIEVIKKYKK